MWRIRAVPGLCLLAGPWAARLRWRVNWGARRCPRLAHASRVSQPYCGCLAAHPGQGSGRVGPCWCGTRGPWCGAPPCALAPGTVALAVAGVGVGAGAGGLSGGGGAVGLAGESRYGWGFGSARVGVGKQCSRADVGSSGVGYLVGPALVVGGGRVVLRGASGRASVAGFGAVAVRCGMPPLWSVGVDSQNSRWVPPVLVRWWRQCVVVVLAGSHMLPIRPHGLVGGFVVGRPLMVVEPL